MANKKKLAVSAVAIAAAASMLLGGTFAWQSISQTALNEKEAVINPGGRLHDDQNWLSAQKNDTNIYVENFTDPDNGGVNIYARVRLEEYMEIVMNRGTKVESVEVVTGSKTKKADSSYEGEATSQDQFDYTYSLHKFGDENATDEYWTWTEGNEDSEAVYYLPTFNKNKDSLLADLNGVFDASVGGFSSSAGTDKYDFEAVAEDSEKEQYAVYDGDADTLDEISRETLLELMEKGETADSFENVKDHVTLKMENHQAAQVGKSNGLISMEDWSALNEGTYSAGTHGNYWVYDSDGWVYWSSPIEPGKATGLLLDSIELNQVMDDTYYYAINVVAQFITADDLGKEDHTGFYDTEAGAAPTENALALLGKIGVHVGNEDADGGEEIPFPYTYTISQKGVYTVIDFDGLEDDEDSDDDEEGMQDLLTLYFYDLGQDENASYTEENRFDKVAINENSYSQESYYGGVEIKEGDILTYNSAQVSQNESPFYLGIKIAAANGSEITLDPIWVEKDKTAPTITDTVSNKTTHTITVSTLSDIDFPLEMTVYKCKDSENLVAYYENIYETIKITKESDGTLTYTEDTFDDTLYNFSISSMELSGDDLVMKCEISAKSYSEDCYFGIGVKDYSWNESTISAPIKLKYIVKLPEKIYFPSSDNEMPYGKSVLLDISTEGYGLGGGQSLGEVITISYPGKDIGLYGVVSNSGDNTQTLSYVEKIDGQFDDSKMVGLIEVDYANNKVSFYPYQTGTYTISYGSVGSATINVLNP